MKAQNKARIFSKKSRPRISSKILTHDSKNVGEPITTVSGLNPKDEYKVPEYDLVAIWRTAIITCLNHPNVLVHPDFETLRRLLELFQVYVNYESSNIMIPIKSMTKQYPIHHLKPRRPFLEMPIILVFAHIKQVFVDQTLNTAIVKEFSIMKKLRDGLSHLTSFIVNHPDAILKHELQFFKNFLLKFGAKESVINDLAHSSTLKLAYSPFKITTPKTCQALLELKYEDFKIENVDDTFIIAEEVVVHSDPAQVNIMSNISSNGSKTLGGNRVRLKNPKYFGGTFVNEKKCVVNQNSSQRRRRSKKFDSETLQEIFSPRKRRHFGRRKMSYEEMPYACMYCPKKFMWVYNANAHILKTHGDVPTLPLRNRRTRKPKQESSRRPSLWFCPVCDMKLSSNHNLRRHIRKLHPQLSLVMNAHTTKNNTNEQQNTVSDNFQGNMSKKLTKTLHIKLKNVREEETNSIRSLSLNRHA